MNDCLGIRAFWGGRFIGKENIFIRHSVCSVSGKQHTADVKRGLTFASALLHINYFFEVFFVFFVVAFFAFLVPHVPQPMYWPPFLKKLIQMVTNIY
jgi:hypothetical protein